MLTLNRDAKIEYVPGTRSIAVVTVDDAVGVELVEVYDMDSRYYNYLAAKIRRQEQEQQGE